MGSANSCRTTPPGGEAGDWDQFGDDGQTAKLILEVVCLPRVADRAAILSSLALHAVEGAEVPEPHIGHIRRFLLAAKGERLIRDVGPRSI